MDKPEIPQYTTPGIPTDESIVFHFDGEEVAIDNEHAKLVWSALSASNGTRSYDDVIDEIMQGDVDRETAEAVVDDLVSLKIVTDALRKYRSFHEATTNPSNQTPRVTASDIRDITGREYKVSDDVIERLDLPEGTSHIAKLLKERKSTRAFESEPIEIAKLGAVLRSAYSFEDKPVPSAGGLYSTRINIIVKPGADYPSGIYEYDPIHDQLLLLDDEYSSKQTEYSLNESNAIHGAPVVAVLSSDVERHTEKYGNRGYRYSILEVGHVAQNLHISAVEQGLATLEYGGFGEEGVKDLISADENYEPIIVVALGYESNEHRKSDYEVLLELEEEYVGEGKPIDYVGVNINRESTAHFYNAQSKFNKPNDAYSDDETVRLASGTATSMHLAQIKAIAEAYERYCSGLVKYERKCRAEELDGSFLTAQDIRPFSAEQFDEFGGLQIHNEDLEIEWVSGMRGDETVWVPADVVFYPLNQELFERKLTTLADSSGVAAHTDLETAEKSAVLELVERDALMRAWFSANPPDKLDPDFIPDFVQSSITDLKTEGFDVHVLNMDAHFPTIQVVIVNEKDEYPFFSNGAASSNDIDAAVEKALEEAQLGIEHALASDKHEQPADTAHISSPSEHGVFYLHPENKEHIEWLWTGNRTSKPQLDTLYEDVVRQFRPIIIRLNSEGEPLHVVRAIAPGLIPINFGVGNEHYAHVNSGVDEKPAHIGTVPHFFA